MKNKTKINNETHQKKLCYIRFVVNTKNENKMKYILTHQKTVFIQSCFQLNMKSGCVNTTHNFVHEIYLFMILNRTYDKIFDSGIGKS